jgi:uncharacterized protein
VANRINEDHADFRKIIDGKLREELKKYIKTGRLFRQRGKNGRISIPIPHIDLPHIVFGRPTEGVGRGPGDKGDIIGKDPDKGKNGKPGEDPGEGMLVQVDLEAIMKMLKDELELPNLLPKENQTFDEVKIKYNGISKIGPRSLLHKKRTMLQAMKRLAALGKLEEKHFLPGFTEPVPLLLPINDDRRYRQYTEHKIPSSNAVIFFARDGSGSMDQYKCDIVSDLCWWLDQWVRMFYKKTERVYIWHDTEAKEVGEEEFYKLRYGGGTKCSSSLKLISNMLENRYKPQKWNIYVFYFGDGENMTNDNGTFCKLIRNDFGSHKVNLVGITQVLHAWGYEDSLKAFVDRQIESSKLDGDYVRTAAINRPEGSSWHEVLKDEAQRDEAIKRALKQLLGKDSKKVLFEKSDVTIKEIA